MAGKAQSLKKTLCRTALLSHVILTRSQCHTAAAEGAQLSTIISVFELPMHLAWWICQYFLRKCIWCDSETQIWAISMDLDPDRVPVVYIYIEMVLARRAHQTKNTTKKCLLHLPVQPNFSELFELFLNLPKYVSGIIVNMFAALMHCAYFHLPT